MPVRIYALAKDLKLDSKELVEICKKAGVTGKGSALASLDDDEVQRVEKYLEAGKQKKAAPAVSVAKGASAPIAPVRGGDVISDRGTANRVIGRRTTGAPSEPAAEPPQSAQADAPPATKPVEDLPAETAKPAEQPVAETTPAKTPAASEPAATSKAPPATPKEKPAASAPKAKPQQPEMSPGPLSPMRRDPVGHGGGGKIRVIGRGSRSSQSSRGEGDSGGAPRAPKRREPSIKINLAALPEAKPPAPKKSGSEPPAQQPEVRFTKDAIAGHKQGDAAGIDKVVSDEKKKPATRPGGLTEFAEKAKGRSPRVSEADEAAEKKRNAGMAGARPDRNRSRRPNNRRDLMEGGGGDFGRRRGGGRHGGGRRRKGVNTAAPRKEAVSLELPCSMRDFCEATGVPVAQVLRFMMGMGVMANINATIDQQTAELIAADMDLTIDLKAHETLEDELITSLEEAEDEEADLVTRAPIVTFLGHVDHGKTSLLDALIGINVVKGEAGGITQHIRAYTVEKDGRAVTFVDTPGHEAFTEMRARGANVTDIAVLVVAADDGIMPQTEEAISHAKAAGVPIVVALNKSDLEGVDPMRAMTQMTEHQLTPSEWGGDTEVVRTSATTGMGLDELLETLLTVADLHEYRANPSRKALGVCLEAEQQGDRGVIAKLVVQNGTLRVGDILVCGSSHGRVRAMTDTLTNAPLQEAGPSTPVNLTGLDIPPGAGDRFHVLSDITQAREIAASREHGSRTESLSGVTTKVSFETFQELLEQGRLGEQQEKTKLNVIIRSDVRGSLEAIDKELTKLENPEVEVRVLQRSVGGVTLADVTLASASDAVILAFNVIPDDAARSLADERGVEIRRYDVIYKLTDEIRLMIEGRLRPEKRNVELGRALVKQIFQISRIGTIAGCYVAQGSIQRGCRIRVNRDGRTIGDYPLDALRRGKEDIKEVPRGMECGIKLSGYNDVKQDDVLEAYKIEEVARTLD
ncbi:Translation initiation factor IF-2 [Roseimaritima multifibrata]|uniref:Translation initiation factor IF-2 n=1 Tax=Roseimaritima multifibrata TaxID=1930274 RepID=A0A517MMW5_9BACT|nr:translation initiation factor IF-2 [Roseimaritima multifibrata]QDS96235.1 Translation initiation factor IF-2 [Roseimaritima multifibrata]